MINIKNKIDRRIKYINRILNTHIKFEFINIYDFNLTTSDTNENVVNTIEYINHQNLTIFELYSYIDGVYSGIRMYHNMKNIK